MLKLNTMLDRTCRQEVSLGSLTALYSLRGLKMVDMAGIQEAYMGEHSTLDTQAYATAVAGMIAALPSCNFILSYYDRAAYNAKMLEHGRKQSM